MPHIFFLYLDKKKIIQTDNIKVKLAIQENERLILDFFQIRKKVIIHKMYKQQTKGNTGYLFLFKFMQTRVHCLSLCKKCI